jgi:serine/threonine protein kinase
VLDFDFIKEIGRGSYGTVFLVKPVTYLSKLPLNSKNSLNAHPCSSKVISTKNSTSELPNEPDTQMVLKKIKLKGIKVKSIINALREATIMREVWEQKGGHPNLIRYFSSFIEGEYLYILMEYAAKGDLY